MEKLLCFDYDCTLLDHATGRIPESALSAIRALRENWKIVIATGRDMTQPESVYGVQAVHPHAMVQMNGARVTVGQQVLYEYHWSDERLRQVVHFSREQGLCISCLVKGVYYTTKPEPLLAFLQECAGTGELPVRPAEEILGTPVGALALVGGEADARLLERTFPWLRVPHFGAQKRGADIIPQELSKAEGMKRLLKHYGSNFAHVVFFGDSGNDLELIRAAGVGVAMGNAIEPVRLAADYVTSAVGEDGVCRALEQLGLLDV